jgi:DNA modification methylase
MSGISSLESYLNTQKIRDHCSRISPHIACNGQTGNHPPVVSVGLVSSLIKSYSDPDQIVYDPFGGSGTTLIAAHSLGRVGRIEELEPQYCKIIIQR